MYFIINSEYPSLLYSLKNTNSTRSYLSTVQLFDKSSIFADSSCACLLWILLLLLSINTNSNISFEKFTRFQGVLFTCRMAAQSARTASWTICSTRCTPGAHIRRTWTVAQDPVRRQRRPRDEQPPPTAAIPSTVGACPTVSMATPTTVGMFLFEFVILSSEFLDF